MSEKLTEIRRKINSLDDRIHDLLMERADLIVGVTEEKKKHNIPVVQPAREAKMIRRLLGRHRGPLPEAAIVGIWRELVGAVSLLQTGLKVSVSNGPGEGACWDLAKGYFGSVLPMVRASTALTAVGAVRNNEVNFAVLPWPHDGEASPWWPFLMNQKEDRMRIVCALPFGAPEKQSSSIQDRALVVSKTDFFPSGGDHSFLSLEIDPSVSRARIMDVFKEAGLKILTLNTKSSAGISGKTLHFIEADDFIGEDDKRLGLIGEKFQEVGGKCLSLGGYPVPPVFGAKKSEEPVSEKKKAS